MRKASAYCAQGGAGGGGAGAPTQEMIAFIDDNKDTFEGEPICKVLPIAPSTYNLRKAQQRDITLLSPHARHDIVLKKAIMRIHEENYNVYGARKV